MKRLALILLAVLPLPLRAADFRFRDGDRVVWIGSTLIEREQRYGYWEAALTAANPDKNIAFRNLGWSGDTVWGEARADFGTAADGYKHLIDHVKAEKPTVLIVGYGTNESFAGPAGLPKFQEQLKKLLDDLAPLKARLVMLAPLKMIKMPPPLPDPTKANANLKLYGEAIAAEAKQRGATFEDPNDHLGDLKDPAAIQLVTDNGLHLTAYGYWETYSAMPHFETESVYIASAPKGNLTEFHPKLKFNYLPIVPPNGLHKGPLTVIEGLPEGTYSLTYDGKPLITASAKEWADGRGLAGGPDDAQFEKLRQTIVAKNELYFHRWRPANITYLFLFRKYEQGQNAREIPQFDPLVAAKEREIAKLRMPVEHVYELVPAKK